MPASRSAVVLGLLAVATLSTAFAQSAAPVQKSTPTQLVDALNGVFGSHQGARAVHAKGIILEGRFTPGKAASSVSKAPHFQNKAVPVVVRFSNFAGVPVVPDNDGHASPRGLAVKFKLPNGDSSDIVAHSFNGFPSPTTDDFRDLLAALGSSGPNAAKPTPLDAYLGTHPVAKAFLTSPKPNPVSFASLPYFGVNTFKFTNAAGKATFGRYQFLPIGGAQYLSDAQAASASPGYLMEEIGPHVKKAPARFRLVLQIAGKDDRLDDPSVAWPDTRKTVELGVLAISRALADDPALDKKLLFIPGALPAGIEPADPMITARSTAYPVSFGRRQ